MLPSGCVSVIAAGRTGAAAAGDGSHGASAIAQPTARRGAERIASSRVGGPGGYPGGPILCGPGRRVKRPRPGCPRAAGPARRGAQRRATMTSRVPGPNSPPSRSPWQRASAKPARGEHGQQLRRRVDPHGVRARVALAASPRSASGWSARRPRAGRTCAARAAAGPRPAASSPSRRRSATSRSRCIVSITSRPPGRRTRRISAEHLRVLLVAQVAERGEQVDRRVEALVGERQRAVVGVHELRPARAGRAAAGLLEQRRRAVDAHDAVARPRQRHGVAPEAAGDVEQVAARRGSGRGGRRRAPAPRASARRGGVGPQVEVAEEGVPRLGRAGRAALHGARV